MQDRYLTINLIVGRRGTGKSTLIKKFADQSPKNTMVFDPNSEHDTSYSVNQFKKVGPFVSELYKSSIIREEYKRDNVNVFIEECTAYFRNNSKDSELEEMVMRNRHIGIEFYLVFHSLRSIPLWFTEYMDTMYLFKTSDKLTIVKQIWKGHSDILEAYENMNGVKMVDARGRFNKIEF